MVDINDREIAVKYPSFERLMERFSRICEVMKETLDEMGNQQEIDGVYVKNNEEDGSCLLVFKIKPVK